MVGLPRNIIKKYGVSKKAWAVFRGRKQRVKYSKVLRRGKTMARRYRRFGRRRRGGGGGFGLGRITSMRNILYTLGGAYLAPSVGVSSNIGGALGGYLGTKSLLGAAAGYFVAPYAMSMISGALGGAQGGASKGW